MTQAPFVIDDDDRYSRLKLISWWNQDKLRAAKILVVGAGALGNEVLKNLALLGVGKIFVVDFDTIEHSNLTRSVLFRSADRGKFKAEVAATAIHDMNPDTQVIPLPLNIITDIGLGLFQEMDVVIGCLDNREARLWVNRQCWKLSKPWIDGGIQEISGVVKVFQPPNNACYECAMTENDYRLINLRYSCPLLSQADMLAGRTPTAPTISSIIAGIQTQEALKLLHGMTVAAGKAHVFNGVTNQFYTTELPYKEDCLSHEQWPAAIPLPITSQLTTASQLFTAAGEYFAEGQPLTLHLERDLVVAMQCQACNTQRSIMRVHYKVKHTETACACGATALPQFVNHVASNESLAEHKLCDLGIPPCDIVRVSQNNVEKTFLLAGDLAGIMR
jgi:molybdopterin-synthase adenylyltransferase